MPSDDHRTQFIANLNAFADSLRHCADLADSIVKSVNDSPEISELVGASDKGKGKVAAESPDADGGKKRKRKPKDPNAPKRPASSYLLFQNAVRSEVKKDHPDLDAKGVLEHISTRWKNMPAEERERYNLAAKNASAQYSEKKKAYDIQTAEANGLNGAPVPIKKATKATKAAAVAPVAEVSSSQESDDDEEDDEDASPPAAAVAEEDSEEEDESEEEPAPQPKKKRAASVQPAAPAKSKKTSKA